MKKKKYSPRHPWRWLLLIVAALCVVAFFTCPSDDDHESQVRQRLHMAVAMALRDYTDRQDNAVGKVAKSLLSLKGISDWTVSRATDAIVSYEVKNYRLFSVCSVRTRGSDDSRAVSIAAFGHVLMPGKQMLSKYVLKSLEESGNAE